MIGTLACIAVIMMIVYCTAAILHRLHIKIWILEFYADEEGRWFLVFWSFMVGVALSQTGEGRHFGNWVALHLARIFS